MLSRISFVFSCLEESDPNRLQLFKETLRLCIGAQKEYLFLPYINHLTSIIPIETSELNEIIEIYKTLIEVAKRKERFTEVSKLINSLFMILSRRPQSEVMSHSDELYRCLTYLIADEEKIFDVENYLTNPLVTKIFAGDEALRSSWSKFVSGDLKTAGEFYKHNEKYFKEEGLSLEDIKDKMRFYRISQIADDNQKISLADLSVQLEADLESTELFLIKSIQYGYVDALIDQMTGIAHFREVHFRNLRKYSKQQMEKEFTELQRKFQEFAEKQKPKGI